VGRVAFVLHWHDVQLLLQESWQQVMQFSYLTM
jgi:hypothetical protein